MDDASDGIDFEVLNVSSEAQDAPGRNLLSSKDSDTWNVDTPGVTDASIAIKLERPSKIQTIKVVNNWTGLLEVQADRVGSGDSGKWETIVAKSSLMTPADSRSKENGQTERLLTLKSDLSSVVWDKLKFICQQPFNKDLRYGLSSVQIFPPAVGSNGTGFQLKRKETNGSIKPGDLFAASSRKDEVDSIVQKEEPEEYVVDAERADTPVENGEEPANKEAEVLEPSASTSTAQPSPRRRGRPKKEDSGFQPSTSKGRQQGVKRKKDDEDTPYEDNEEDDEEGSARRKTRRGVKTQDLKGILKGCIICVSGFVNPLRAELRQKLLDMGGKYRPEWGDDCTHLVCAVASTPKFDQVRALGGRIVKKEWIEECYKNKRMLPWRTFMLKPKTSKKNEDDDEEEAKFNEDEEWEPEADESSGEEEEDEDEEVEEDLADELHDPLSDIDEEEFSAHEEDLEELESESSGEDKKSRKRSGKGKKPAPKKPKKTSPKRRRGGVHYDDETDEEDEDDLDLTDSEEAQLDDGKDFMPRQRPLFRNMHFYLFGEFPDETEEDELKALITDLAGMIHEGNDELVTHCVTPLKWSREFEEVKQENPRMVFVKPKWVYDCRDKRTLMDPRLYQPPRND